MIGLVLAMLWARRSQAVVVAALALFGVAAAVAAPAFLRAADRAVAAGQVETAVPGELTVSVLARHKEPDPVSGRPAPQDPDLAGGGSALLGLPGFDYVSSTEFPAIGIEKSLKYATRFVHRQKVCEHVVMTAGRCLAGESDIILGEQTGRRLGLTAGDSVEMAAAERVNPGNPTYEPVGKPRRFLVAGLYRATDPGEGYWGPHGYFAPAPEVPPGVAPEPAFVSSRTLGTTGHGKFYTGLDAYPSPRALAVDRLPAVRDGLAAMEAGVQSLGPAAELRSDLPALLARIDSGRAAGHRIVPVLAVALVVLACLTIALAVGYGTEGRRPELAVVALRGARRGQRWWLATGEHVVAVLIGAVAGCFAGQLVVNAFFAIRFPGVGTDPGPSSLRWAPVAAGAAVLTALAAERRQIATPVVDLLRRAPVAPHSARAIAAELVVVLLAVVAVVQLSSSLRGVGTAAATLTLVAASLVTARLSVPFAAGLGRWALRRGRLGLALACFQLSRRPGAVRLLGLLTAAVAVLGYAAAAVDVGDRGRAEQAAVGTGAARVVHVTGSGRQNLLAAVRAVDPAGTFAMAALRVPSVRGTTTVLAVDTPRLALVATWPSRAPAPAEVARTLRPPAPPPVPVDGARVSFDITAAGFQPSRLPLLTAVLVPRDGGNDEEVDLGPVRNGRRSYGRAVPACAAGCTLHALRVTADAGTLGVAGRLILHRVGGKGPGRGGPGAVLTDPARWRASEGGRISGHPDGLTIDVLSLNGLPGGLIVLPVTAPSPLPVAVAGPAAPSSIAGLDGRAVRIDPRVALPAVPGVGSPAVLADLDYTAKLAGDGAASTDAMVWLNDRAPADAVARLAARGLRVTGEVRAAEVRAGLDHQGPAIALWFYVIVAALVTALAAGLLVLATAVDRSRRTEDLQVLRDQGLSRAPVRRATLWTYPALVLVAVLSGLGVSTLGWWLTGWALPLAGLDPPALPLPGRPLWPVMVLTGGGAAVMLSGAALLAGRSTLRRIR